MFGLDLDDDDLQEDAPAQEQQFTGKPVLVLFFSGGMTAAQGKDTMKMFIKAAEEKGLTDIILLGHATEPYYEGCNTWKSYTTKLAAQVDDEASHKGRPLIVVAHSHGCLEAFGFCQQLGNRVLKLYVVARRDPGTELLGEVWGVSHPSDLDSLSDQELLQGLVGAWTNSLLEGFVGKDFPPGIQKVMNVIRAQYSSPCTPCASEDMEAVLEAGATIPVPILGIACTQEKAKGETEEKMECWRKFTSKEFSLVTLEDDHVTCFFSPDLHSMILDDMKPFLS
eukprot:gnl/MRDRNA2_/MRDRNA2_113925_c0_seq1.p1 gnl/MRDRNA2_/MRDRNA2_113925_c0~~gnl/MRDRNA2_/MRDRNA2_113925_c0_seq1.p1  ORF type:complete len:281 (-),score=52.77 gnl/MRDRNA2_/MRDRNA2_113925_c0_seq1:72-914(-)